MKVDNIHGLIGKKMKKSPIIANFKEFHDLVDNSGKGIKPVKLTSSEIYEVEKKSLSRKSKGLDLPSLEEVVEVEFRKGHHRTLFSSSSSVTNHALNVISLFRSSTLKVFRRQRKVTGALHKERKTNHWLSDRCAPVKFFFFGMICLQMSNVRTWLNI